MNIGPDRQREIYLAGAAGIKPLVPTNFPALEKAARHAMSENAFAYIAGGAGMEKTMAYNRAAFDRWSIVPRFLRDVSVRDTSIQLFGKQLPSPLMLAPIGVLEMAHRDADLAVARAAANMGVPYIFSSQASVPMEKAAAAMGDAAHWFQLYWSKSDELVASFVRRAEACGCSAIVVTLDTTLLGWRPRDLNLGYLPFLEGKGIAQYTSDPVFQRLMDEPEEGPAPPRKVTLDAIGTLLKMKSNYPGGFWKNLRSDRPLKAVRKFIQIYSRPSLTWDNLSFLRDLTQLPILLKGILHEDDARKAMELGINGLIVTNHGGRQVDGSISTLDALPSIVQATGGSIPIILDSGIRGGADVFKALALGATAVCIGRPYCYGLALAGQAGVEEVIRNYWSEFDLTMGLAGTKSVQEINRSALRQ